MNVNVVILCNGITSQIAHGVSQNLLADDMFNVEWYLNECRSFLLSVGLEDYLVEDIIDEAHSMGITEFATGCMVSGVSAGAQIHPSVMLGKSAYQLLYELKENEQ